MGNLAEHAFRRHYDDVYRFVRRRSVSVADAEDIAAEVFADAARGLDGLQLDAKPMLAWLFTVARRRLADEARRRSRSPAIADGDDVEGALEYGPEITDVRTPPEGSVEIFGGPGGGIGWLTRDGVAVSLDVQHGDVLSAARSLEPIG